METYIIPHFATEGDWWTGFDIYNHNSEEASIKIDFLDPAGKIIHTEEQIIKPKSSYLFTDSMIKEKMINKSLILRRMLVTGPEGLLLTTFQGNEKGTFNFIPFYKDSELKN